MSIPETMSRYIYINCSLVILYFHTGTFFMIAKPMVSNKMSTGMPYDLDRGLNVVINRSTERCPKTTRSVCNDVSV